MDGLFSIRSYGVLCVLLESRPDLWYDFSRKLTKGGVVKLNIFPSDGALNEARVYMQVAGYPDFTKRDLKNLTRVMKGYLPAGEYAKQVAGKYYHVHGDAGRCGGPSGVPENLIRTRDPAILYVAERKILPARLVQEFRFGPAVGFSAEDLIELNKRLFGDIYTSAGKLRPGLDYQELDGFLRKHNEILRHCPSGAHGMCPAFEDLFGSLLGLAPFVTGNLITAMAFVTKIAYFWGYVCRFEDSGEEGKYVFDLSDRIVSRKGTVEVA